MKGIRDQNYEYAQQVLNRITSGHENITLGYYHDIYLATDVLLLVDVFETFRNACLKNYKLDPAQFYTAPGLAWQALLKTALTALSTVSMKKTAKTVNYVPTSSDLSCLQI